MTPQGNFNAPLNGMTRAASIFNVLKSSTVAFAIVIGVAEFVMPVGYRPSDMIGGFIGKMEATTIAAHTEATANLARQQAEATVQAQVQAQKMNEALEAQSTMANMADFACIAGMIMGGPKSDADFNQDAVAATGSALSAGCGIGDQIRNNISQTIGRNGQLPAN